MSSVKRSNTAYRKQITPEQLAKSCGQVLQRLDERLVEKGMGTWLSRHEIQGFTTEEYHELIDAVHKGSLQDVRSELVDMAVGCLFAVTCIDSETLDW
jgi:hypothetical protein